jgi:hypothetical protein
MDVSSIFTAPGIGGIIVGVVLLSATVIYVGLTRWILQGGRDAERPWERMGWPFN